MRLIVALLLMTLTAPAWAEYQPSVKAQYLAQLVVDIVLTLVWLFLNAGLLLGGFKAIKGWSIRYKRALLVALKASFVALLFSHLALLVAGGVMESIARGTAEALLDPIYGKAVKAPVWLATWYLVHCNALVKQTDALAKLSEVSTPLTVKEARAISARVLPYWLAVVLSLGYIFMGYS